MVKKIALRHLKDERPSFQCNVCCLRFTAAEDASVLRQFRDHVKQLHGVNRSARLLMLHK
jgi:hypothetical protein